MKEGLLWFDNDPKKPLGEKVQEAARRFKAKFGTEPNVCYVNPAALSNGQVHVKVRVTSARAIQPNYFWLGVEKEN